VGFANTAKEVEDALQHGDRQAAMARLHALRGTVGTIGGMELMALAGTLETAIAQGADENDLQAQLTALTEQLGQLIAAIQLELAPPGNSADDAGPAEAPVLAQEKMDALLEALAQSALSALDLFAELRPALNGLADPDTMGQIEADIKSLRFKSALDRLQPLRNVPHPD